MTFEEDLMVALAGGEVLPDVETLKSASAAIDADQATQWLSHLDNVRKRRQELKAAYAAAVKRLDDYTNPELERLAADESILEEALAFYHSIKVAEDPKHNLTITYPVGTLASGEWGGEKWEQVDRPAFDSWAIKHLPGAVDIPQPLVKWAEAKKLIKAAEKTVDEEGVVHLGDGSVIPGIRILPPVRQYVAKTAHGDK